MELYKISIWTFPQIKVLQEKVDPKNVNQLNYWDLDEERVCDYCYSLDSQVQVNINKYFEAKINNLTTRIKNAENLIPILKEQRIKLKRYIK